MADEQNENPKDEKPDLLQIAEDKVKHLELGLDSFILDNTPTQKYVRENLEKIIPLRKAASDAIKNAKEANLNTTVLENRVNNAAKAATDYVEENRSRLEKESAKVKSYEDIEKNSEAQNLNAQEVDLQKVYDYAAQKVDDVKKAVERLKQLTEIPAPDAELQAAVSVLRKERDEAKDAIIQAKEIGCYIQNLGNELSNAEDAWDTIAKKYNSFYAKSSPEYIARNLIEKTQGLIKSAEINKSNPAEHVKAQQAYTKAIDDAITARNNFKNDNNKYAVMMINAAISNSANLLDNVPKPAPEPKPKREAGARTSGEPKPEAEAKIYVKSDIEKALGANAAKYKIEGDEHHALVNSKKDGTPQFMVTPAEVKARINLTDNKEAAEDMLRMTAGLFKEPFYVITKDPAEGAFLKETGLNIKPPIEVKIFASREALEAARAEAKAEDKKAAAPAKPVGPEGDKPKAEVLKTVPKLEAIVKTVPAPPPPPIEDGPGRRP